MALKAIRRTKGTSGQHLVERFHEQMEKTMQWHSRARIGLRWTPSHSGMIGNECADEEAKKAAREGSSPMASSLSHAEAAY